MMKATCLLLKFYIFISDVISALFILCRQAGILCTADQGHLFITDQLKLVSKLTQGRQAFCALFILRFSSCNQ
jgi:hypothetical protein